MGYFLSHRGFLIVVFSAGKGLGFFWRHAETLQEEQQYFAFRLVTDTSTTIRTLFAIEVQTSPGLELLCRHREYWAKSIFTFRHLRSDFVSPCSIRFFCNLTFNQRDSFFLGPEFLAGANSMRIPSRNPHRSHRSGRQKYRLVGFLLWRSRRQLGESSGLRLWCSCVKDPPFMNAPGVDWDSGLADDATGKSCGGRLYLLKFYCEPNLGEAKGKYLI